MEEVQRLRQEVAELRRENAALAAVSGPRWISGAEVEARLPMAAAIEQTAASLKALAAGTAAMPVRSVFPLPQLSPIGFLASMPAYAQMKGRAVCGMKAITVFPGNSAAELNPHQGCVLIYEATNGKLLALVEAHSLTAIRTAAASAVATQQLALPSASVLAVIGTGTQARKHVEAIVAVRPIQKVRVWGRSAKRAGATVAELSAAYPDLVVSNVADAEECVRGAHIVCTVTGATAPVLSHSWLARGCHVNAVGACTPKHRELDTACVLDSVLFVDTRDACTREPGDIVQPMAEGAQIDIKAEIGEVLLGAEGRTSPDEITVFKSVGAAVEDIYCAVYIVETYEKG